VTTCKAYCVNSSNLQPASESVMNNALWVLFCWGDFLRHDFDCESPVPKDTAKAGDNPVAQSLPHFESEEVHLPGRSHQQVRLKDVSKEVD